MILLGLEDVVTFDVSQPEIRSKYPTDQCQHTLSLAEMQSLIESAILIDPNYYQAPTFTAKVASKCLYQRA